MLATDRLIFLSAGRSSTGTIHRWLCEIPELQIISSIPHESYHSMVPKYRALGIVVPPAWTVVRNPWDRYVDAYYWDQNRVHRHEGMFKDFLRRTRAKEQGFPSYTGYWDAIGADMAIHVARYENFDDDVVRVIMALIPDLVTEEFIRLKNEEYITEGDALMADGAPWRLQPPGSYVRYYDDESCGWVAEMDAKLIDRFGYQFGETRNVSNR